MTIVPDLNYYLYLPWWKPCVTSRCLSPGLPAALRTETLHTPHTLKTTTNLLVECIKHKNQTHEAPTHLRTSRSSRPWGRAPPGASHADTCTPAGGDSAAGRSAPPDTRGVRRSPGGRRPPRLHSTPAGGRAPCRTAPGCSSAPPPDSLKTQTLCL